MHVVGHVSYDRFNGSVSNIFNNAFQHSHQPCFLSQTQWFNCSHFLKKHFVYILQSVYSKKEGSVLQYISRKGKPTHCIHSLQKMDYKEVTTVPFLSIFIFSCFMSVAYKFSYTSLKDSD